MNDQVKCLQEYRSSMVTNTNELSRGEQCVKSAFDSIVQLSSSNLIRPEKLVTESCSKYEDVYIPISTSCKHLSTVDCLGCGQMFKSSDRYSEPAYYIHCLKECEEYKKLNLMRKCESCKKIFISHESMGNHSCHQPVKPIWMTTEMYHTSRRKKLESKPCPGCKKLLPSSYEFLIHAVEDCSSSIHLVKECSECKCKFPNVSSYYRHYFRRHGYEMQKPKWMTKGTFRHSKVVSKSSQTTPIPCHGCGQELQMKSTRYRTEDYVHMIEECEKYQQLELIRTCKTCKCKFINQNAIGTHKC